MKNLAFEFQDNSMYRAIWKQTNCRTKMRNQVYREVETWLTRRLWHQLKVPLKETPR